MDNEITSSLIDFTNKQAEANKKTLELMAEITDKILELDARVAGIETKLYKTAPLK